MTVRHLRIFVAVYQEGSITKASASLHLAQPSVSLAIRELEEYYGVRLFDRMSRRIYVTDMGREFYNYAIHIVSLFEEMEQKIRNWDTVGTLRVGSSVTIGNVILPSLVQRFQKEHPQIDVHVSIYNSNTLEQCILDNRIDFALVEGDSSHPQITQLPFMEDRLCLICGKNDPLADQESVMLRDLEKRSFLLREIGSAGRELFDSVMLMNHFPVEPVWESVSTQAIITAVAKGLGISVLPQLLVKDAIDQGEVLEKRVEDASFTRKFSVIYHKNKYLSASAKTFIQLCREKAE